MQCFEHNCEGNQAYIEISCNDFVSINLNVLRKGLKKYTDTILIFKLNPLP